MSSLTRRDFLKATSLAGAALLVNGAPVLAQTSSALKPAKLRGVNLGGWLVLEKWMTPTLFAGVQAEDEYSFSQVLGKEKAAAKLQKHRETWITADDFKWLAAHGINSVRLPVGYWVLEENPPFITGVETLDWAFRTAKQNGLSVLLDLHGVPGSQNGWDHSGRAGALGWHNSKENIAHSLRVIEELARHCKTHDNLLGIELVNEPKEEVPLEILRTYYRDGFQRVRKQLPQTTVVVHDGFRAQQWEDFMPKSETGDLLLDTHLYQCFSDQDRQREIAGQIQLAAVDRKQQLDKMQQQHHCIVGEWSLGLPPKSLRGLSGLAREAAMRAFGAAQLVSYESTRGWYFWSYRTEAGGGWNFRDCVEHGWLPPKFDV